MTADPMRRLREELGRAIKGEYLSPSTACRFATLLLAALEVVQMAQENVWADNSGGEYPLRCVSCDEIMTQSQRHASGCELDAALRRFDEALKEGK